MNLDLDIDVSKFPWPDGKKRLFEHGGNNPDTAFIHPVDRTWENYARGYQAAYERLFETWDTHWLKTDPIIYPLAFLCRQYLELSIKDLIQQSQNLLQLPEDWPKVHKIDVLWNALRPLVRKIWENDPEETLDHVEALILEFASLDKYSMTFRYPTDRDENLHLPEFKSLDVAALQAAMKQLSAFFEGLSCGTSEYLSNLNSS